MTNWLVSVQFSELILNFFIKVKQHVLLIHVVV